MTSQNPAGPARERRQPYSYQTPEELRHPPRHTCVAIVCQSIASASTLLRAGRSTARRSCEPGKVSLP